MSINNKTNADIACWTLNGLMLVVSFLVAAIAVMIVSASLQFVPFKENTAAALLAVFMGGIGVSVVLLVLNIAANLSLIAGLKLEEHRIAHPYSGQTSRMKQWVIFAGVLIALGLALTLGGTVYSKWRFQKIFAEQAQAIQQDNQSVFAGIVRKIGNGYNPNRQDLATAMKVLESQQNSINSVSVIWSSTVMEKRIFEMQDNYFYKDRSQNFYTCDGPELCLWLNEFFDGKDKKPYRNFAFINDVYAIYVPVVQDGKRFVLLLTRRQDYGKIGSS
jgi:hypothetical protein